MHIIPTQPKLNQISPKDPQKDPYLDNKTGGHIFKDAAYGYMAFDLDCYNFNCFCKCPSMVQPSQIKTCFQSSAAIMPYLVADK